MLQLTQKLGSGDMIVQEVPIPQVEEGMILVKNHFSVISAGTEGTTVTSARKNYLQKAREKPKQVKLVIDTLKATGPVQTYRAIKKKLDAYSPLGYSSSGEVIATGNGISEFKVGDLVACAGIGYANHAEVIAVPQNLCVRLDNNANLKLASYNTLGAIALQGIRQADLKLGESCVVIGLGLIGQLTCQMLKASGVEVLGIDVSKSSVDITKKHCTSNAWERNVLGLEGIILDKSNGQGVDAVIITAGTSSLDPVNFAGKLARRKGKIIIVGVLPTGFDRECYYKKELELRMSCSYGPGRYDLDYEEKGVDYPYAYVRWTENRNMIAFQQLVFRKKINIDYLTSHEFGFEEATDAFNLIVEKTEPHLGIILKYNISKKAQRIAIQTNTPKETGEITISFIGAGSYAQGNLLPNLPKNKHVQNIGICTNSGTTSKRVAEKFGFQYALADVQSIINKETNTVFIATKHNTHAKYVIDCLKAKKNVFVEKPLCLDEKELKQIQDLYTSGDNQLMVGFNRRFAPLAITLKTKLHNAPVSIIYRINAGYIPKESWLQDIEIGGGRIIGEVCHFLDFVIWLIGSQINKVQCFSIEDPNSFHDTISINLQFVNGSIATIHYFSNGPKSLPKEYIEVYQSGFSGIIMDFKILELYGKSKSKQRLLNQDKGQSKMVKTFINNLIEERPSPISFEEIYQVTSISFKVLESLRNGTIIKIT
jgi:predicted dehydrogenase/threonine dehydrogenase-like Zn-dependent dehydrogenase